MSSPVERRYRQLLRLLPKGYRAAWEEDMVATYLDSAGDRTRPSAGERLSVVALAVQVRLDGAYGRPRHGIWRHTVHSVALLALLLMTTFIDASVVLDVRRAARTGLANVDWLSIATATVLPLLAFLGFVIGRGLLARLLILPGAALLATTAIGGFRHIAANPTTALMNFVVPLSFAVLLVTAMLALPRDARPSRWGWLAAWVAGIAAQLWMQLQHLDGAIINELALAGAMMIALALERYRAPHWLFALAIFGALFVGLRIASGPTPVPVFDGLVSGLAVACAVVGFVMLRRQPATATTAPDVA